MRSKAKLAIAGSLAAAFYAASLWLLYPDNRQTIVDTYQSWGEKFDVLEASPPASPPRRYFIAAGYGKMPSSVYQATKVVDACSENGKVLRLAYEVNVHADEKRSELLEHPRIAGDITKYEAYRNADVSGFLQKAWEQEAKSFRSADLHDHARGDALQEWLQKRAEELYARQKIKIALRINIDQALEMIAPDPETLNACSPPGFVPAPPQSDHTLQEPEVKPF